MEIPPEFTELIQTYLTSVNLSSHARRKGWKIPETTLVYPWIRAHVSRSKYIFWIRDPRDCILGRHLTDDLQDFGIAYPLTDDVRLRRAISWKYQYDLVKATPRPQHWLEVRFEDFVLNQEETLARLGGVSRLPAGADPGEPGRRGTLESRRRRRLLSISSNRPCVNTDMTDPVPTGDQLRLTEEVTCSESCVIGMGPIGNRHADMYREDALAELVGVCDIIPQRADAAAERLGVPAYLRRRRDAGPAQARPVQHHDRRLRIRQRPLRADHAGAGGRVPCARREADLQRDRRGGSDGGQGPRERPCYGINLNHRFTPAARLAKQWQDEGRLGHLLFVNMSMWIMNPAESSPYFQIKALHPHTVDVMRHFCGDVEAVQCFATKAPGRTIWSTAQFNMRFKNGVVGSLTGSYDIERGHPMERCEVAGIKGRFVIEDMWREATLYPAGNPEKTVYTNPIFGGMRDFTDTFRNRIHTFPGTSHCGRRRRRRLTVRARTVWRRRRFWRRRSSRWRRKRSSMCNERMTDMKLGANSVLFGGYDLETAFKHISLGRLRRHRALGHSRT